mmetsp:Transcript_80314/g.260153  ORF Transcript_80314/g.260153 Transcript_80314/m.260153 type:complete len:299 (+) Transcript_80314:68-964(+)
MQRPALRESYEREAMQLLSCMQQPPGCRSASPMRWLPGQLTLEVTPDSPCPISTTPRQWRQPGGPWEDPSGSHQLPRSKNSSAGASRTTRAARAPPGPSCPNAAPRSLDLGLNGQRSLRMLHRLQMTLLPTHGHHPSLAACCAQSRREPPSPPPPISGPRGRNLAARTGHPSQSSSPSPPKWQGGIHRHRSQWPRRQAHRCRRGGTTQPRERAVGVSSPRRGSRLPIGCKYGTTTSLRATRTAWDLPSSGEDLGRGHAKLQHHRPCIHAIQPCADADPKRDGHQWQTPGRVNTSQSRL